MHREDTANQEIERLTSELTALRDSLDKALIAAEEERLHARSAEARLEAVLSSMCEGLYQLDLQGRVDYLNPAAEALLGYRFSDVAGSDFHELIHSRRPENLQETKECCNLWQSISEQHLYDSNDDYFLRSDGGFLHVQYFSAPLMMDGAVIGTVVSFQDITERKAAEKRLREFYATLSHELRTPLSSILASLVLMDCGKVGPLDPKAAKLVNVSRTECDRIVRLVNDILDLSKIESGMFELHLTKASVGQLVENAVSFQTALAQQRHIKLKTKIGKCREVVCDGDRILQVINNFLSNAIKYSPENTTVRISVTESDGQVKVLVQDQGVGIPTDQIYRLFKRFHRLESTGGTRGPSGTGLGLAICKALVEQHKGIIGVESDVGKGSVFWFALPV